MWTGWRYSDVVEYSLGRLQQVQAELAGIENADVEYTEKLNSLLLIKILQKL